MNTFGTNIKVTTWGESHGIAHGVVIDGIPPGISISEEDIQQELDRRKPGQNKLVTPRKEDDKVNILSGIFKGKTTGTPISLIIYNKNQDSASYEELQQLVRPGHADFTYHHKYKGQNDFRGGGRSSGRETVSRVAAGAIARKILLSNGINIISYIKQIGKIKAEKFDLETISKNSIGCPDDSAAKKMIDYIEEIKKDGDSVGGLIGVKITGCPIGLGEPVFDKLDAKLAYAIMSIGAVKGVSFGAGFKVAEMKGSENNDQIRSNGFQSNNAGGILGGLSTGEEITIQVAVKPTPSISKKQQTITIARENIDLNIKGRHDPCICLRIRPAIEAMVALTLLDVYC